MAQQSMTLPFPGFAGSQQVASPTRERIPAARPSDVEKDNVRRANAASVIGPHSQQQRTDPQSLPVRG